MNFVRYCIFLSVLDILAVMQLLVFFTGMYNSEHNFDIHVSAQLMLPCNNTHVLLLSRLKVT